jgi:MFS family permease
LRQGELFSFWSWIVEFLRARRGDTAAGERDPVASVTGFGVVATGLVGCLVAGKCADRYGRIPVCAASLLVSGLCSLFLGATLDAPYAVSVAVAAVRRPVSISYLLLFLFLTDGLRRCGARR